MSVKQLPIRPCFQTCCQGKKNACCTVGVTHSYSLPLTTKSACPSTDLSRKAVRRKQKEAEEGGRGERSCIGRQSLNPKLLFHKQPQLMNKVSAIRLSITASIKQTGSSCQAMHKIYKIQPQSPQPQHGLLATLLLPLLYRLTLRRELVRL